MSSQQLIEDLKSSREIAKNSLNQVFLKISKYKDEVKSKSSLSYNAIHSICLAIKAGGEFYEIYLNALDKLAANVSDYHWNRFVELLRYMLSEFYSKKLFKWTAVIAAHAKADRIKTPADVKSHLKLYSRQLLSCHTHMDEREIQELFKSITVLLVQCKKIQFEDLVGDFYTHFVGSTFMVPNVIIKHMDKVAPIFESLFAAIGALKFPQEKLNQEFITLMKYLVNFLYLDFTDKNTVHSMNFLRSCKDNQSLKEQKYPNYSLNLFYYFIKILLFPNELDFNARLVEILGNFSIFFDRVELASEPWFMDTITTMSRILDTVKGQNHILQGLNEESHQQVFALLEKLMKLAHGVNYESGLWSCCNSARKHIIFKICNVQLVMFESVVEKSFTKAGLGSSVYTILKHTVAVAEFFKCVNVNFELGSMLSALARCSQNAKTKEHGEQLAKMLWTMTKLKATLPENSVRTIAKCLMHVFKASGNTQAQVEACALYIAHLVEIKGDTDLIKKYMGMFYSLEPCASILETLDGSAFPMKPEGFNRRYLHSMEASVFCKRRDNNILAVTSLLKSAETTLDFVLIARQCPQVNVSSKLDRKCAELKGKPSLTAEEYLAFGHICKIRAIQQMDELKNTFDVPKLSDETLPRIMDQNKLKLIDVASEMQVIKLAKQGIDSFEKFFEFALHQAMPEANFFVEWEPIIDDIAILARQFHFRGYIDFAYVSWRLLLRIATHLNDMLNQIRALSFICDECQFIELYDPEFDIENEIRSCEGKIVECLMNMEFLTPRKQNYVLICLCNYAWYLALKSRYQESQILLDLALVKAEEIEERKNKFELVHATHLAVSFRIKWKLQQELSNREAFAGVDKILDEIRAVVYFTSEDSLNFPILLFAVVTDITEFTTNRLCEPATLPYVQMVLKLALDAGAAFRIVQFLVLWTHINLQTENVIKCQIKLDLIDILFRTVPSAKSLKAYSNIKVANHLDIDPVQPYLAYGEEAVRKAVYVNPISPVRVVSTRWYVKHKAPTLNRDLESFLITHHSDCACDKCSHTFLSWYLFKIGCLNARLLYLGEVYTESDVFYTKAVEWCTKSFHKSHTKFQFREYELTMFIHYINLLRRMGNLKAAITICEAARNVYNKFKGALDGAYLVNLSQQMESTAADIQKNHLKPVRRSLKFTLKEQKSKPTPASTLVKMKGRARTKKESPETLREKIENIIYKDPSTTPAVQKSRAKDIKRREKNIEKSVEQLGKAIEQVCLDEELPRRPTVTLSSSRRAGRHNLNTAIIIIDDDGESPEASIKQKIPKSASKIECTPKTRGRTKRIQPATVAKTEEVEARKKLQLRRRI